VLWLSLCCQSSKQVKAPRSSTIATTLPDGSRVTLNAGSRISYNKGFGYSNRNLVLDGEAYFEVRKNEEVPFVISAGEAQVKVYGTMFNVKAYKRKPELKVTVSEGSVLLYKTKQPENQTKLEAGETGTFNNASGVIDKRILLNYNDIAWKPRF
jgi:ferric-dicitrate binding protein FerR (iron transport regulator)